MDYYSLKKIFSGLPHADEPNFKELEKFYDHHKVSILSTLPWMISELIENDGFDCMSEFVRLHGGSRLYLNKDRIRFIEKTGIAISEKTYATFTRNTAPSGVLDIPSAWGIFLGLRKVAVKSVLAQGIGMHQIARDFGVTARSLRKMLRMDGL
ncbi:hypothetical protein [Musicola paradisiaca]|uniref:Mor transcription activator domain-containing protein n=1 Tax=Musicola paradisiaca (strain Ech703) TaxID=579405 RepID=C6C711_MUSP7|nr:hypothetical protein [Musicola paradisiaca]ACS85905.1 hypothetical protein Dd703_2118 [Musicola paradisiaca Ech703]